jgi:hypothetical protein
MWNLDFSLKNAGPHATRVRRTRMRRDPGIPSDAGGDK